MTLTRLAFATVVSATATSACEGGATSKGGVGADVSLDVADGGKTDTPFESDTTGEFDTSDEFDTSATPDAEAALDTDAPDSAPEPDTRLDLDITSGPDTTSDDSSAGGPVTATFGTISGACGTLGEAFTSPEPSFHSNVYDFDAAFDPAALRSLAKKRLDGNNNGGSSKCSETMSIQTLYDCEGLVGLKTELEITWDVVGQTTDWLGEVDGVKVGVSVSRAYQGPNDQTYTVDDAVTLLTKKLGGINESTTNVNAADAWDKQVLHLWTLQPSWVAILEEGWNTLPSELRADTIIVVTVEQGSTAITTDDCQ